MRIFIRHGKNRSSRYTILSRNALDILTQYWFAFGRLTGFLFPKQNGSDKPIDTFFVSRHIHDVERSLGWEERITCHSLRHAFGTHLYEDGVDLLTIKSGRYSNILTMPILLGTIISPACSKKQHGLS